MKCYSFALVMSMKSFVQARGATSCRRICVIFPGALGDFICFLPALQFLRRDAEIDLFAHSEFTAIVPAGVTVRSLESHEIARLFAPDATQDACVQSTFGAYAAVYSWTGSQQREFVEQLKFVSNGRAQVFPFRPAGTTEHQTDYYLRCLAAPPSDCPEPRIEFAAETIAWREKFCTVNKLDVRPVLVIAPGSGALEKNWPEEFFVTIANWWRQSIGGTVVILVGPVEAERGGIDRLQQNCLVANELNLAQAAALLAKSDVYLGNDSGISHLAAAVGVLTIALFGPSDPLRWSPRGPKITVINRRLDCAPCSNAIMKSCLHRACLTGLRPEEITEKLARLLEVSTLTRGGVGITV